MRDGRALRFDVAGTHFQIDGLPARTIDVATRRWRAFLTKRAPRVRITLSRGTRRRSGRRPRLIRTGASIELTMGPCRAVFQTPLRDVSLTVPREFPPLHPTALRLVCSLALFERHGFLLHAAAVAERGRGRIFCGPSGSGKTTIARLRGHRQFLNDDTVAVLRDRGRFKVWATPFFGEGGLETAPRNAGVPLRTIFFLHQAHRFGHRRLTPAETVQRAISQVFLPKSDPAVAEALLDVLGDLASGVPAYDLFFAPRPEVWEYIDAVD